MAIVRVSSECQVSIPEALLIKLGSKPGQEMMIVERDGGIVLTPLPADPIAFLCGALAGGPSLTKELTEERTKEIEQ